MTLDQIGGVMGLTRERVRQIEAKAFDDLQDNKAAHDGLDLVRSLESGSLDGASPQGWVEPPGGPVITLTERKRMSLAFRKLENRPLCGRSSCKHPSRNLYVYGSGVSGVVLNRQYCSYKCARSSKQESSS